MIQDLPGNLVTDMLKIGGPAATTLAWIFIYHKFIAPKGNGQNTTEILFKLDLALTEHFDQLRRDLEAKISSLEGRVLKTLEDRLTVYLFRQELDRPRKERR